MVRHYLDHASTSPLRPESRAAIVAWLDSPAGDPGRVHEEATAVRAAIEDARDQVAALLGVGSRQVVFTSGGTEAVHAAAWGACWARPGGAVLSAAVEHSSVRDSSGRLAPVAELAVDDHGRIDPDAVTAALRRLGGVPPALVHCQWANHEVATVQPVEEVVARGHRAGALVHVDAVAACGHMPLGTGGAGPGSAGPSGVGSLASLDGDGPDLVSVSAHKLGGPPGIGALVVRRGLRLEPLLVGGQQERSRRAGMENVVGIVGFGAAAVALAGDAVAEEAVRARRQTDRLAAAALAEPGVVQVGDPEGRLPHVVCLGIEGVEAEPVLLGLDRAGIAAHSGSACAAETLEPSPVLAAMGADPSHSLRLSVGWSTTDADIDAFASAFGPVVAELRALRG